MLETIKLTEKIEYLIKTDCAIQISSELGGISISVRGIRKPICQEILVTRGELKRYNYSQEYSDRIIEELCRTFNDNYEKYKEPIKIRTHHE